MNKFQYFIVSTVVLLSTVLLVYHTAYDGDTHHRLIGGQLPLAEPASTLNAAQRDLAIPWRDDKLELEDPIKIAKETLNLIRHRYELDGIGAPFFRTANNIGPLTWDVIKYKFAKKIVGKNEKFLMVFGGSSVTAGHDNFYNQSYPFVVKRRLGPLLDYLGVELVVQDIAQGN